MIMDYSRSFTTCFSKIFTAFILVSLPLALLPQTSFGSYPYAHCYTNTENFTTNSNYETYLRILNLKLIAKSSSSGFGVTTAGHYKNQKTYGLFLCRGDVSATECKTCVSDASIEISNRCPYNKGAVMWYNYCMLKYLDTEFFGEVDNTAFVYVWKRNSVSDPDAFNLKTRRFLGLLAEKTYADNNPKLYAAGEQRLENSTTLYGFTQCTRDLSSRDCKACLNDALDRLLDCCDGRPGGRVLGGSCNFRYEIFPFLDD
ncbi:hypothetical protein Fmac_019388 [Flemingia macrophylla]|uniref:Gnk2-homologous domain-containing protein n=1 Tax=Flemingia macrophylla TaxID=520843 RepID=A0ABD1M7R5_9FABA